MAKFCLTKQTITQFKKALKDGDLNPFAMADMTTEQRRELLSQYVGEHAQDVNALFESKLLLKNQKAGYQAWVKKVAGISKEVRRDLLARIERLDSVLSATEEKVFLSDLVEARLGLDLTVQEANAISDLAGDITKHKAKADKDGNFLNEPDRLTYGSAQVALENYVNELKLGAKKTFFREQPLIKIRETITEMPGAVKSTVASLDNSFWGRQGIKTLLDYKTSPIWFKNFLRSFADFARQVRGVDAVDLIKADIYSRPNALNGKYKAGGFGLDVLTEEAFPSSLPEKIPVLGRLFKASEAAYNGGALRLRADLADRLIKIAEGNGVNMLDKTQAEGFGRLVRSMTGRGNLGDFEPAAGKLNVALFSPRFLKANIDTLTAGLTDRKVRQNPIARKQAAQSLLRIITTVSAITALAGLLDPDSVDPDPRSTNFGKIKIFGKWTDITGGMAGLVRLASYMVPTYHDGKLSLWKKTSTGKWVDLRSGEFGSDDAWDTLLDGLISNKLSPLAGLFRDAVRGEFFGGEPFTVKGAVEKSVTPLSIQSSREYLKDPDATNPLATIILEGLGFSSSATKIFEKDWNQNITKTHKAFKNKVGAQRFDQANKAYNTRYNKWHDSVKDKPQFKKLSQEEKDAVIRRSKDAIEKRIYKSYGFEYKNVKPNKKLDALIAK